jgi:hypothetical protein
MKFLLNITQGYFFYIIALTPTDPDASTQKNRLDNHFVQAAAAWHLISQPLPNIPAYGSLANTTVTTSSAGGFASTLSTVYGSATSTATLTSAAQPKST